MEQGGSRFLTLDRSALFHHTLTVPSAPQRLPERGSTLVMPTLIMTPSHQDMSPGSCATWQQLIPFGLQRFIGVGRQSTLSLRMDS